MVSPLGAAGFVGAALTEILPSVISNSGGVVSGSDVVTSTNFAVSSALALF